jgi:hypothetical protein
VSRSLRPAALFAQSDADAVREEVSAVRGLDAEARARLLESLCALAVELVMQHPDPARALAWQDPLPAESEALLARLRANAREAGGVWRGADG